MHRFASGASRPASLNHGASNVGRGHPGHFGVIAVILGSFAEACTEDQAFEPPGKLSRSARSFSRPDAALFWRR